MQANECMHALTHISLWQMHAIMKCSRTGCMNVIYITRQISKKPGIHLTIGVGYLTTIQQKLFGKLH